MGLLTLQSQEYLVVTCIVEELKWKCVEVEGHGVELTPLTYLLGFTKPLLNPWSHRVAIIHIMNIIIVYSGLTIYLEEVKKFVAWLHVTM